MNDSLRALADELRADGPRRFSRWDTAAFDAAVSGPVAALAATLGQQADTVVSGYLRVVQQAVGHGVLRQVAAGASGWTNALERLLVESVPASLAAVPSTKRLKVLTDVWNLGEGLLREPVWVDRYVTACVPKLGRLDKLESFLVDALGPVLSPPPQAKWTGKHRVDVLDLRPVVDDFLPGEVRLAAPAVLCVTDRRRPTLQVGVLLRPGGSELLGVVSGLGTYPDPGPLPAVDFTDGKLTVAGRAILVPMVRRRLGLVVSATGFVAVTTPDSQRVWAIECE